MKTAISSTIAYLRQCQEARKRGCRIAYTTDPAWLVMMAINRRAGWPDDPSEYRGSAMPVNGQYPKKASGGRYKHLERIARDVNTARLVVRMEGLGEWRGLIMGRIGGRITQGEW